MESVTWLHEKGNGLRFGRLDHPCRRVVSLGGRSGHVSSQRGNIRGIGPPVRPFCTMRREGDRFILCAHVCIPALEVIGHQAMTPREMLRTGAKKTTVRMRDLAGPGKGWKLNGIVSKGIAGQPSRKTESGIGIKSAQIVRNGVRMRGTPMATILIVEDELLERAIYADLLRDHGYEVLAVPTASRALEFLRFQAVDLILVDLVLPGMSGIELIERLRTVAPETPVIVVTAHPSSDYAMTALRLGAFDLIGKGFKNEIMLHAVKRAVDRRQLELRPRPALQEILT